MEVLKLSKFSLFLLLHYPHLYEVFNDNALALQQNEKGVNQLRILLSQEQYTDKQKQQLFDVWEKFNPFINLNVA